MGFNSHLARITDEVTLSEISKLSAEVITLDVLKEARLISKSIQFVKVILSGELTRALTVQGLRVTKGARQSIEDLGGSIQP